MSYHFIYEDIKNIPVDVLLCPVNYMEIQKLKLDEEKLIKNGVTVDESKGTVFKNIAYMHVQRWTDGKHDERKHLEKSCFAALKMEAEHGCTKMSLSLNNIINQTRYPLKIAITAIKNSVIKFTDKYECEVYLEMPGLEEASMELPWVGKTITYVKYGLFDRDKPLASVAGNISYKRSIGSEEKESIIESVNKYLYEHRADTFTEKVRKIIKIKNLKNTDVYRNAGIDRRLFSKIINDNQYHPDKETAIKFSIGLKLPLDSAQELLCLAGHWLSDSTQRDKIIKSFFERKDFNLFTLNYALSLFNEAELGRPPRK